MSLQPDRASPSRARDFVLYVAISLAVAMLAVLMGRSKMSAQAASQWFGLFFYSAIVYGVFVSANWRSRRRGRFWIVTTTAFCVHAAVFATIIITVTQWRPMWSAVIFLELPLLDLVTDRFRARPQTEATLG